MSIRVNWKQKVVASDRLIRAHKIRSSSQPESCRFRKMTEFNDFRNEEMAIREMKRRDNKKYKRCKHCWDNRIVKI